MFSCNWGGMYGLHGGFMGGGLFGILWSVLLLVLFIYLGAKLIGFFFEGNQGRRDREDSLEILRTRYARGEIDDKEYQRIKDILAH